MLMHDMMALADESSLLVIARVTQHDLVAFARWNGVLEQYKRWLRLQLHYDLPCVWSASLKQRYLSHPFPFSWIARAMMLH